MGWSLIHEPGFLVPGLVVGLSLAVEGSQWTLEFEVSMNAMALDTRLAVSLFLLSQALPCRFALHCPFELLEAIVDWKWRHWLRKRCVNLLCLFFSSTKLCLVVFALHCPFELLEAILRLEMAPLAQKYHGK